MLTFKKPRPAEIATYIYISTCQKHYSYNNNKTFNAFALKHSKHSLKTIKSNQMNIFKFIYFLL